MKTTTALAIALAAPLLLPAPAARAQIAATWRGDGSGNQSNGFWNDPASWNPNAVPNNNNNGATYNVTVPQDPNGAFFNGPQLNINVTVQNLSLVNRAIIDNQFQTASPTSLNVLGSTTFSTTPGHDGAYGVFFDFNAGYRLGTLTNYTPGTKTLEAGFLAAFGNNATIQFRGADIVTNNGAIALSQPGARILNQSNGANALANLAVNNGTFQLGARADFTTAGAFTNNGALIVGSDAPDAPTAFSATGGFTNYDPLTKTLTGGFYFLTGANGGAANVRFPGADIRTLVNATVGLSGNARITDYEGRDAFRNLDTIGQGAQFTSANGQTHTPAGGTFTNDGGTHTIAPGANVTVTGNYQGNNGGQTNVGAPTGSANTTLLVTGGATINGGSVDMGGQPGVNTQYHSQLTVMNGLTFSGGSALTGTGTIIADTLFIEASRLAPGHSPGQLTFQGALTLEPGTRLEMQLAGLTAGTEFDQVLQTGPQFLTLGGELVVTFLDGFESTVTAADTFSLFRSDHLLLGAFDNVASGTRLLTDDGLGSFLVTYGGTNDVILSQFQGVPEPGTYALTALGGLGLLLFAQRARRAA